MENEKLTKFNGVFEIDKTYESNTWLRVKIRTFAFGKNRNGSDILNSSLSNFSNAKNSVGAVPIVAKYNEEKDDLEGHNVLLRKNKDDEYEIYHDTNALGFTSPFTEFHFEEVNEGTDDNPNYKTYVVIDDVYLWKRYDATKKIIEWFNEGITPRVSMEIDNVKGQFDKDGYFQIQDFEFTGIAALGSDVEPCFPKADIQLYTVNEFKQDLKQLMFELGLEMNSIKGGKDVEDVKQEFEEVVETTEAEVVETIEEKVEEVTEETVEVDDTFEQVETEETQVESEIETVEEIIEETFSKEFVEGLNSQITTLNSELDELRAYKRQREEQDLRDKFAHQVSEEEFNQLFGEDSLEEIETKIYALIGKKNFSLVEEKPVNKVKINVNKDVKEDNPYKGFFN